MMNVRNPLFGAYFQKMTFWIHSTKARKEKSRPIIRLPNYFNLRGENRIFCSEFPITEKTKSTREAELDLFQFQLENPF